MNYDIKMGIIIFLLPCLLIFGTISFTSWVKETNETEVEKCIETCRYAFALDSKNKYECVKNICEPLLSTQCNERNL